MARKLDIKHREKSHPTLSAEEARQRELDRQRERRARRKLEQATDPEIKIKEEGAVQLSFSSGME
jgi:hypothetical protein